ncbi:uncharacterized protein LOC143248110 [Tachypleus tridentatus]|uniref:uncharacterized protein LOC143248110 n=1 Tax=Tachypleus tridentatus TaxID=6853 RepID=UPI003FD29651
MNSVFIPATVTEQSIASARASVMVYDDLNRRWLPSGSSSGLSKVHIYQHIVNNTFRVVGRKIQDREVVINCAILKGLKYNQATPTFHQWRDNRQVYGLNFSSKDDAHAFAVAMLKALEVLDQNNSTLPRPSQPPVVPQHYQQQQPIYQQQQQKTCLSSSAAAATASLPTDRPTNAQKKWCMSEKLASCNLTREDSGGERRQSAIQYATSTVGSYSSTSHPAPPTSASPSGSGHHRSPSAPLSTPPPAPPPMPAQPAAPPPPPPLPPSHGAPLAPPPPPIGGSQTLPRQGSTNTTPVSLAAALQTARLRTTQPKVSDNEPPRPAPVGLMDEMTKTLARRRAQAENNRNSQDGEPTTPASEGKRSWERQSSVNGFSPGKGSSSESPKQICRSLFESFVDGDLCRANGIDPVDTDRLKQELLTEIKKEINKMKQDIIEVKLEWCYFYPQMIEVLHRLGIVFKGIFRGSAPSNFTPTHYIFIQLTPPYVRSHQLIGKSPYRSQAQLKI